MKNVIIVTGGSVTSSLLLDTIKEYKDSYIIGVDRGLDILRECGITPNLAMGDFDSASEESREFFEDNPSTVIFKPEKDFTDTHAAVLRALEMKPESVMLLGATGSRVDHMLANIGMLKLCVVGGVEGFILDDNNRIRMIDKHCKLEKKSLYGKYISCIPFSDRVTGVSLEGFLYPLTDATIIKEDSIGVSNELREEEGHIYVDTGYLLVMETKD